MDPWSIVFLWLHFAGLAVGAVATFGIPVIGAAMADAPAEARPVLAGRIAILQKFGHTGLGALIVTGLLMEWLGAGTGASPAWFWTKMVLVAALFVMILFATANGRKAIQGDAAAMARAPMLSMVNIGIVLVIVLAAVLTFS